MDQADALMAGLAIEFEAAAELPYGSTTNHPCPNIFEPPCADGSGCSPNDEAVLLDSSPPLFTWSYDCHPDGYRYALREAHLEHDDVLHAQDLTTYDPSIHGPICSDQPEVVL